MTKLFRNRPTSINYRNDIQGLRAIAIAIVVLAHADVPGFAGGFVGVDVFFVLSGYLITGLLIREQTRTNGIRYGRFLARRLRRLLPAMLVMLVVSLFLASTLLSAYETRMQTVSFGFAVTWTSNLFFAFSNFDYFDALKAKDLFLHTWSLGVEEQFYLVWPWLVILSYAFAGRARNQAYVLLEALAIVFLGGLLLCLTWSRSDPFMAFYMMPSRAWQFALGAAVFIWFDTHDVRYRNTIGAAGVALILGSAVLFHEELVYPGHYAIFPSAGAALVILAGCGENKSRFVSVLGSTPFKWLGDRSYSLYLWHWPILLIGSAYGLDMRVSGTIVLVLLSVLLASLCYRHIELPFWKGRYSETTALRTVLVSVLAMVVAVGLHFGLRATVYGEDSAMVAGEYDPRLDAPGIYTAGFNCDTGHLSSQLVPCGAGSTETPHTAVLVGDSIGAQWVSMLPEIYTPPDWQVTVLTKSACAVIDEEYYYDKVGGPYKVCTRWRNSVLDYIDEVEPDIVFIGSSASYAFSEAQWTEGSKRILQRLTRAARQVVIIPGTPPLSFDGPSCLEQPYRFSFRLVDSRRECEEAQSSSNSEDVAGWLEAAAAAFPNAHVLNLNDVVCPARRCAASNGDGVVVFRDQQHLTDSFVVHSSVEAGKRLRAFGLGPQQLSASQ